MDNRPLTAKETSAIEGYCNTDSDTYNNWCQSYLKAGYSKCTGWQTNAIKVLHKNCIRQAVSDFRARTGQEWEHDRRIAVDSLNLNILRLQRKADTGDVQAASAITACIRELNAISALHSSTVITHDKPQPLTEAQRAELQAQARVLTKPRLATECA